MKVFENHETGLNRFFLVFQHKIHGSSISQSIVRTKKVCWAKKFKGESFSGNQNVALFAPKIRLKMVRLGSVLRLWRMWSNLKTIPQILDYWCHHILTIIWLTSIPRDFLEVWVSFLADISLPREHSPYYCTAGLQFNKTGLDQERKYVVFCT